MKKNDCVVLVDSLTPRDYYIPLILSRGYDIVHVTSSFDPKSYYYNYAIESAERNKDKYIVNLHESMGMDALVEKIKSYAPVAIINSSEAGTLLTAELAARLGLPGNDVTLDHASRDKFLMQEALKKNGLRYIRSLKSNDPDEVINWVTTHDLFPVVVKPLDSGGSDGVELCRSTDDIVAAFALLLNKKNIIGLMNDHLLVEEFVQGREIAINTASRDGKHAVSDMWLYEHHWVGSKMVYDSTQLVDDFGDQTDMIVEYVFQVLDALGIRTGAAHTEIMLPEEDLPVLMETGARPMGGGTSLDLYEKCLYHTQFSLTLDACLDPERFGKIRADGYRTKQPMVFKPLISSVSGALKALPGPDNLKKLSSFYACDFSNCEKTQAVSKTVDFFTSPGMVYLTSENRTTLMNDLATIKDWETNHPEKLFVVMKQDE